MGEEGVIVNISWVSKRILGNGKKVNGAVAGPDPVPVSGRGAFAGARGTKSQILLGGARRGRLGHI